MNNEKINVLDHGYVQYIEHWGSDERIIEAARMSTDGGFRGWGPKPCGVAGHEPWMTCPCNKAGDEKLLRFLYEHKHMTPFEMAGMVIEVQAPIMVFREWHRHRTQCLRGNTKITCVSPNGTPYQRTIKEIYDLKYGGVVDNFEGITKNGYSKRGTPVTRKRRLKNTTRVHILPNCQERTLRVLDEASGEFTTGKMLDVYQSGEKQLFEVTTTRGMVEASEEHPFYTNKGWKKVKELSIGDLIASPGVVAAVERPIPPSLREGIGVWTSMMRVRLIKPIDFCYKCMQEFTFGELELDHVIPVCDNLKLALDEANLKPICKDCHRIKTNDEQPSRVGQTKTGVRWARVVSITKSCIEMTYDIALAGKHHNFVANGLVVHNSYNEMSGRYIELPDLCYIPSEERLMNAKQSKSNKQGSEEGFDGTDALHMQECIQQCYDYCRATYDEFLEFGVSREIARLVLPVNQYSRMRASANLRNWLAFLTLRMDTSAQWEIQQYANTVANIIKELFPRTYGLYAEELNG